MNNHTKESFGKFLRHIGRKHLLLVFISFINVAILLTLSLNDIIVYANNETKLVHTHIVLLLLTIPYFLGEVKRYEKYCRMITNMEKGFKVEL